MAVSHGRQDAAAGGVVAPGEAGQPAMSHREIMRVFSGLLLALLVAILSSTIVANALPTITAELHGTQAQYTWVVTATLLGATATTPVWGKLADLFSKKLLLQIAISVFTLGSVLGGLAQSMPVLIGFRAVQGLGLGGVQALVQVVIAAMISPRERGRYSGYLGAVFAVGTVSGPLIGGLIVDTPWLGWRWCFLAGVPVAVAALLVIGRTLRLPTVRRPARVDWLGATLLVGGVSLLLVWVSLAGQSFAWASSTTALLVGGAVVLLGLALVVESRAADPVVPLRFFRDRTTALSVVAGVGLGVAMFGVPVFIGQYFQVARGYSPTVAGLMTIPLVLTLALTSTFSGQLISRFGRWKRFLLVGSVALPVGLGLLATIDHRTDLVLVGVFLAVVGAGVGLCAQNLVLAVQNTVPARDLGSATALVTFFRSLGGASGVSALGAVLSASVAARVGTGGGQSASLDLAVLPEGVRAEVMAAFGDATGTVFLAAALVALVTLFAVLGIREVPLRTTVDEEPAGKATPGSSSGVLAASASARSGERP
ncbi:MFS transporter [Actinoalloteichus spitiensis]|uniref:MDR family MFS transporter n=1 Tax=Actinoalloteichus spitiensis TaxID=252394 RepID=UPI0003610298